MTASPCKAPRCSGFLRQGQAQILQRGADLTREVVGCGALVMRLGEIGRMVDGGCQMLGRKAVVACLERLCTALQQQIHAGRSRAGPFRLNLAQDQFRRAVVFGGAKLCHQVGNRAASAWAAPANSAAATICLMKVNRRVI